MVEGATPLFLPLVRHRGGVKGDRENDTLTLPSAGGRSLHSGPCGKAEMLNTGTRVVLLNVAQVSGRPLRMAAAIGDSDKPCDLASKY